MFAVLLEAWPLPFHLCFSLFAGSQRDSARARTHTHTHTHTYTNTHTHTHTHTHELAPPEESGPVEDGICINILMQACQRDRYIDPAANKRLNPYKLTPGSPRRGLPQSNGDVRARSSKAKAHLRPAARGSKNTENNDTSKRGLEGRWDADPRRYPKPYRQYIRSLMIQQRAALRHATGTAGWTQEQLKEGIQVRISRRRT